MPSGGEFVDRRTGDKRPIDRPRGRDGEQADLAAVMHEIVELMQANAAMLTIHPGDGEPPALLFADEALPVAQRQAMMQICAAVRPDFTPGRAFWRIGVPSRENAVMLLPVERTPGHSQVVISLLFDHATGEVREHAERIYSDRRPFAIGYFRVWQINRTLTRRTTALQSVLDQTDLAILLIDHGGRLVFTNTAADEMLSVGDGLARSKGLLRATRLDDSVSLQAAIGHVIAEGQRDGQRAPLLAFRRRNGPALIATVLPAGPTPAEADDIAVGLYVIDPAMDAGRLLAPLCRLHRLSPVETTLVCHLARGESIATVAEHMHVKEQTARSYLKQIFIKTGTRRQIELVSLFLSSIIRVRNTIVQEAVQSPDGELLV